MQNPSQEIIALFADPVAGNPAQFVVERALAALGLDHRYLSLEVTRDNLLAAIEGARVMGFRGLHLDEPHREAMAPGASQGPEPTVSQVANCLVRDGEAFRPVNTLGAGCVAAANDVTTLSGKRVMLLGAGKMARSVAVELAKAGVARLLVVNRTPERGEALAASLREQLQLDCASARWDGDCAIADDCDVLIHATSLAESDTNARVPVMENSLRRELLVVDVTLEPSTHLLRAARAAGCETVDGLTIYVRHVAAAIHLWTGKTPDHAIMREALEEFLEV